MTNSIEDYLSDISLKRGDRVELSLLAENELKSKMTAEMPMRPKEFMFSLEITVNGRKYNPIPLATAIKSTPRILAYGRKEEELQQISKAVRELGYSRGAVLEPFFEVPKLGLERAMSSDSIVYIFGGLIEYAQVVSKNVASGIEEKIKLGNKEVGAKEITQMREAVLTAFQGYRNLVMDDYRLLNREEISGTMY